MSERTTPETDAAANDSIVKVYETSKRLERQRDTLLEFARNVHESSSSSRLRRLALETIRSITP